MANPALNQKLIDFEGASILYKDLRNKIEKGDEASLNALQTHEAASNPHKITKATIDLGLVENTADKDKNVATAQKWATTRTVDLGGLDSDLQGSFSLDGSSNVTASITVKDDSHSHTTKTITGLDEILANKLNSGDFNNLWNTALKGEKGVANGLASLDAEGHVLQNQLPSYVDDVLEFDFKDGVHPDKSVFPVTGESGKIYVSKNDNKTWRWSGSTYIEISSSIVVGTTSGTAFDGLEGSNLKSAVGTKDDLDTVDTAFGRIKKVSNQLGTIDVASNTTAFGKIKSLEDAVGGTGGSSLSSRIDNLRTDLGQPTDPSTTNTTAFGRIKKTEENFNKINLTFDKDKNVLSATKLATPIKVTLVGGVTGEVTGVDGSKAISITTTVDSSKHSHTTAQITDLQGKLNAKLDASAMIGPEKLYIATTAEITENIINAPIV